MAASNSKDPSDLIKYLKPGMKISATIQFGPDDNYAFSTSLVGFKAEQCLILDMPIKAQEALVMRKLVNVQIVVRGMSDTELGHVIAFNTSVIQVISSPCTLIFIRPPKHFFTKTIREHERYKISIPVALTEKSEQLERSFNGTLVDFSISGCGVFVTGENELTVNNTIRISSELDDLLPDDLACHIANIRRQSKGHMIGVQFENPLTMSDELKMVLFDQTFKSGML